MTSNDLAAAIREHHEQHGPSQFVQAQGASGEIAVAEAPDGSTRRVVLVTSSDEIGICAVLLASNMVDQATDHDLVVRSAESGAPYDVMIQAELYGPVFREQLDRLVGTCDPDATSAIGTALRTDGESLEGRATGMPLGGTDDPRRRFKEEELQELLPIVSKCRGWRAGDLAEVVSIKPEMLFPPPPDTPHHEVLDQLERIYDILNSLEVSARPLPWELLALMDDATRAEIHRWRTEYGVQDVWTRLHQVAERQLNFVVTPPTPRDQLAEALLRAHAEEGTPTLDLVVTTVTSTTVRTLMSSDGRKILRARERTLEEVA